MLQYREFPLKTAAFLVMSSVPLAYCIYVISGLLSGTLLSVSILEHHGYLGMGALAATITLPLAGLVADRIRFHDQLYLLASFLPLVGGLVRLFPPSFLDGGQIDLLFSGLTFAGLAAMAVLWVIRANQSIVARYRGRTVGLLLLFAIAFYAVFTVLPGYGLVLFAQDIGLPTALGLIAGVAAGALRPWRFARASFGTAGSAAKYFVPMVFILAAHLLWYFVTKGSLEEFFVGDPSFQSLAQYTGFTFLQLAPLGVGVVVSSASADLRGRKATFSTLLFLMGLLTIFGSALYQTYFEVGWAGLLTALLLAERFIEGYMLGLCLFLIWPELGSAKRKGLRTSLIWFFFLGYVTLFWALDLNATVFGLDFHFPSVLRSFGGQFAILFSLIALYLIGPLPEIVGREIEMEDLSFDFDEKQVRKTVDAFVGADDFASIRQQVDIIDAGQELSDSDMSEILGEEFREMLPLRKIPGVGDALEKKLQAAGYESAAQLAGETSQRLSQRIDGLSVARAESILKEARKIVKKTIKKNKK